MISAGVRVLHIYTSVFLLHHAFVFNQNYSSTTILLYVQVRAVSRGLLMKLQIGDDTKKKKQYKNQLLLSQLYSIAFIY